MKFLIAIITFALAAASTSAVSHIKVTCTSVSYAKYYYAEKDCTGEPTMTAAFKPDVCTNTGTTLSAGKSSKFAYNATTKMFTQTAYDKVDCAGTAQSLGFSPQNIKLDTCTVGTLGALGYKIIALSQAVDYHLADETCDGLSVYMGSGDCYSGTKITCAADNKKFDYQLWEGDTCSGDPDVLNAKALETGKCLELAEISGAGSFSVISSFAIMMFVMMFM